MLSCDRNSGYWHHHGKAGWGGLIVFLLNLPLRMTIISPCNMKSISKPYYIYVISCEWTLSLLLCENIPSLLFTFNLQVSLSPLSQCSVHWLPWDMSWLRLSSWTAPVPKTDHLTSAPSLPSLLTSTPNCLSAILHYTLTLLHLLWIAWRNLQK